jgi:hypothetical protein
MTRSDKPHVIRLRGPWRVVRFETDSVDVRLPVRSADVAPGDFRGQIELRRSFNWPEPLGYRESLWIVVIEAAWPRFSVELNGRPLGTVAGVDPLPAAWEITPRVTDHNELRLTWNIDERASAEDASWVEVQLEVRLDVGPQS